MCLSISKILLPMSPQRTKHLQHANGHPLVESIELIGTLDLRLEPAGFASPCGRPAQMPELRGGVVVVQVNSRERMAAKSCGGSGTSRN